MPGTYLGTPTATQPPDSEPEPEKAPSGRLPANGDSLNVSSFYQSFKGLLDHASWLIKPRAKAQEWAQSIVIWRSAALHRRFAVSHFGFPAGKLNHVRDELLSEFKETNSTDGRQGVGLVTVLNAPSHTLLDSLRGTSIAAPDSFTAQYVEEQVRVSNLLPGWTYNIETDPDPPDGVVAPTWVWFRGPSNVEPNRRSSRWLTTSSGPTVGDVAEVSRISSFAFDASIVAELEFDARIYVPSGNGTANAHVFGWRDPTAFASALPTAITAGGAYFSATPGGYFTATVKGSFASPMTTAVPVDESWHRFRIVWVGASVDDAATERVLFFIDGVLVANYDVADGRNPTSLNRPDFYAGTETIVESSNHSYLCIGGPIVISNNTWLDEV